MSEATGMGNSGGERIVEKLPENCHISGVSNPTPSQKEESIETHDQEIDFSSPTPVKTKESSRLKRQELSVEELPGNFKVLQEFYDSMTSSLRLLSLRNKTPTFQNVSCQVEILTGRKFLPMHLAQIKHLIPEAVQIDKILVHDEKTKCMKPDMKITLLFDVIDDHCEESEFLALSNLLASRLRDFFITHTKDTEVPEAVLPEPFNQKSFTLGEDSVSKGLSGSLDTESLIPSLFSPTFRKCFSEKAASLEILKTNPLPDLKSTNVIHEKIVIHEKVTSTEPSDFSTNPSICERTPKKLTSVSESLLVETPVQSTPMRPISSNASALTCEDEKKTTASHNSKEPTASAKKSLDFYFLDGEESKNSPKETSFCLAELVQLIQKIFQSINSHPITKEELIQKIVLHHFEIDDLSNIDTQLEHLEKLVPDWFYKKMTSSGDILYNVKRISDMNSIYERVNAI